MVTYLHTFQEGMFHVCLISQISPFCKKIWIHRNGKSRTFPNLLKRHRQVAVDENPCHDSFDKRLCHSVFQIILLNFEGEEKLTQKLQQYLSDMIIQIFKMQLQLHQHQENAFQHCKLVFYFTSRSCLCWRHRRFGFIKQTALKQLAD